MKLPTAALCAPLLLAACQSTAGSDVWRGQIEQWGSLREAIHDGRSEARVNVADVARRGIYGVGALEGLRGEITILDGEVWITLGDPVQPLTRFTTDAPATVLVATEVRAWQAVQVAQDVKPAGFEEFVVRAARQAGLDTSRAFPFVVDGGLRHLRLHVIAGQCPIHARAVGAELKSPPYELHTMATQGRLVGFFAPNSTGVVCHHGTSVHAHAIIEGEQGALTGHVEAVGLAAGATLRLPLP